MQILNSYLVCGICFFVTIIQTTTQTLTFGFNYKHITISVDYNFPADNHLKTQYPKLTPMPERKLFQDLGC